MKVNNIALVSMDGWKFRMPPEIVDTVNVENVATIYHS